jgi:lipopolysaccharide biosynthesis glycosyltransferase
MSVAIAMITDQKGYALARYALASVLLSQTHDYTPYLFVDRWDGPTDSDGLLHLGRSVGRPIEVVKFDTNVFGQMGLKARSHVSLAAYLKFDALQYLSKRFDRALYADTDMLFYRSLDIAGVDFHGNPIGAVYDLGECLLHDVQGVEAKCYSSGYARDYFNSGLMLLDCAHGAFEALGPIYEAHCQTHLLQCPYDDRCALNDQCPFNMTFENRWTPLPLTWNVQSITMQTDLWDQAAIRHYTGLMKFLPLRARRADKKERRLIAKLATALGDTLPTLWPGMGALYWANALRRARARANVVRATQITEYNTRTRREAIASAQ